MNKIQTAESLIKLAKILLSEEPATIFDITTVDAFLHSLKTQIKAPYVSGYSSTLGGGDRTVSVLLTVCLDEKKDWINGIMENNRYFHMHIYRNGVMEMFSGGTRELKFRKSKAKSTEDCITRINKYLSQTSHLPKW